NQRTDGDQSASHGTDRYARYVCQRTGAVGGVGQDSDDHPLNARVYHSAEQQGGEESEGSVAPGVSRFTHGSKRGFETAIGEDQEQHGLQPWTRARGYDWGGCDIPVLALKNEQT